MVDRVKLGRASKARGSGFETEVANKLCAWYKDKDAFYRVPASGALEWSTSMNVDGDVTANPKINFPYMIECKRYENWNIENLLRNNLHFPAWVAQSVREGHAIKRIPFLVYKRNYHPIYVTAPFSRTIANSLDPYVVKTIEYNSEEHEGKESIKTITFFLDDMLKLSKDKVYSLYPTDWYKQVKKAKVKKHKVKDPMLVANQALKGLDL